MKGLLLKNKKMNLANDIHNVIRLLPKVIWLREPLCITQEKKEQTNTFNWIHKTTKVEAHDDNILFSFFSHLDNNVVTSKQMRKVRPLTLPDLWSGTMKLIIVLSPGAGSSTVMVVKSWKTKCKCQQNDLGMVGSADDFKKIEREVKLYIM